MNDCPNAEIRDQLPDLLHGRLDEAVRAVVDAHVASCVDCHEELELLRAVLGMVEAQTPQVDIAAIVRALPAPPQAVLVDDGIEPAGVLATSNAKAEQPAQKVVSIASRRRVWSDWRVAAAVTLLVAGGSSAVLLKRGSTGATTVNAAPVVATSTPTTGGALDSSPAIPPTTSSTIAAVAATSAQIPSTVAEADDRANTDLGNGNRLGDLNEQELQTLLNKIDKLPAVPVTEPEPVSLHLNSQSSSGGA